MFKNLKRKVVSVNAMRTGELEVQIYSFSNSALGGGECLTSSPGRCNPGKKPGTRFVCVRVFSIELYGSFSILTQQGSSQQIKLFTYNNWNT
jgi:hypothetical protein